MTREGKIRRARQALDQLRLAMDYVALAVNTLLDDLEAKPIQEEPTRREKPTHAFRPGYNHPAQPRSGGPYCQDCGHTRSHPNHHG